MTRAQRTQLLLKVTLADVTPVVWRRLLVPGYYVLDALHQIIQTAMGWHDKHLYTFTVRDRELQIPEFEGPTVGPDDPRGVSLNALHLTQDSVFHYTYDLGDDWVHEIAVEGIAEHPSDRLVPACVGGGRACPPEDAGGAPGYLALLRALKGPPSPANRELRAWAPPGFDPDALDLAAVNRRLAGPRLAPKRSRTRPRAV